MADAHAAQPQLLFVDGSLPELTEEMGDYLHIGDEVRSHLKDNKPEDALQAIVKASQSLNSTPEREFTPAYSLLIHLVINSPEPKKYLPVICQNLQRPITSSPQHGTSLALFAFQSIFNFLKYDDPLRYNVWMQILKFVKQTGSWDLLKSSSSLEKMQAWFKDWDTEEEGQRRMLIDTAEVAGDAGDEE
jgi:translation initiation factor 3 subunit M